MSEETITIEADTQPVEEAIADCEQQLDQVETQRQETMQVTSGSLRHAARAISGMVGITVSMLEGLGVSLDPLGQAIIGSVTSTISALQAIAIAMTSNPITAAFGIVTAGAAIILSAITLVDTITGVNRSKNELRQAQSMLRLLHSTMTLSRAVGGSEGY